MIPISWDITAIFDTNLPLGMNDRLFLQLWLPCFARPVNHWYLEFSLTNQSCVVFDWPFFPAMMWLAVSHQGRVPAGQMSKPMVALLQCTFHHKRLSTDNAWLWMMQRHWLDLTRVALQELTLLIHHTQHSLIKLLFIAIASHLLLNHDQPRFVVWDFHQNHGRAWGSSIGATPNDNVPSNLRMTCIHSKNVVVPDAVGRQHVSLW